MGADLGPLNRVLLEPSQNGVTIPVPAPYEGEAYDLKLGKKVRTVICAQTVRFFRDKADLPSSHGFRVIERELIPGRLWCIAGEDPESWKDFAPIAK